jgi:hypothetical protein
MRQKNMRAFFSAYDGDKPIEFINKMYDQNAAFVKSL